MFEQLSLASYDTDKSPQYLATYEREFGRLADQPIRLLELGVQRGGSLLLWRDVLPKATIAGLDLNPTELDVDTDRVRIYQGFQQDPAVLAQIAGEVAPDGFDVVIDDASHVGRYTAESFWEIFPKYLKPGGVYILDDCDSAYRPDWADGHRFTGKPSTIGIGHAADEPAAASAPPSRAEGLRQRARAAARPIAQQLSARSPQLRARLERAYMKVEGATMQTRFPSHDHGMIGVAKQLADAVSADLIAQYAGLAPTQRIIESVTFLPRQIVVRKVG